MENQQSDSYKLYYFKLNGKANITRAILTYSKVKFDDNKYSSFEEWASVKNSGDFEFNQLPMLETNGLKMVQSAAINLHLARKFNLLGSTPEQDYLHTSLLCSFDDINPKFAPAVFAMTEEGKAQMKTKEKEFLETHGPYFLKIYENRFNKYKGKYAVGDSFSLSDIFFTVVLTNIFRLPSRKDTWEPVLLNNAPNLAAHIDKIAKNELAEYFEKVFITETPL